MKVLITTFGRYPKILTRRWIPNTQLVVQEREAWKYKDEKDLIVLPPEIQKLSPTRQWLLENIPGKVILLDDDLDFLVRRTDDLTKFRQPTDDFADMDIMLMDIESALDDYCHVGVASREGGNRITNEYLWATRQLRLLAFDFDKLKMLGVRFDRLECMSDFDMTLQLLELGEPNIILNMWGQGQRGSNAKGGCSAYRTIDRLKIAAEGLHALHPEFVTLVEKETKGAWGGGKRTDVRMAWKKAFKSSGKELPTCR